MLCCRPGWSEEDELEDYKPEFLHHRCVTIAIRSPDQLMLVRHATQQLHERLSLFSSRGAKNNDDME
eukprot:SAG11_NODE_5881_length_1442_cov_1.313477_1_plen_67_part_00